MFHVLTTKKDHVTRGARYEEYSRFRWKIWFWGKNLTSKPKKMRIKKNYKPKANDKERENAIFFETWPSLWKNVKNTYVRTSHVLGNVSNSAANHSTFLSGNKKPREIWKEVSMIKLCKYLYTMWNRTGSRFVAGLNNITDRFLCKANFILSRSLMTLHTFTKQVRKATRLNLRTDSTPEPHKVLHA